MNDYKDLWKPYDPTWLIEPAREQFPELDWLPDALAKCTRALRESDYYFRFSDPAIEKWEIDYDYDVEIEINEGFIRIDILAGQRVGGIEVESVFYEQVGCVSAYSEYSGANIGLPEKRKTNILYILSLVFIFALFTTLPIILLQRYGHPYYTLAGLVVVGAIGACLTGWNFVETLMALTVTSIIAAIFINMFAYIIILPGMVASLKWMYTASCIFEKDALDDE